MRAWLTRASPHVGFGALLALIALVPAVFWRRSAEAFMVPKVTLLWLGLVVASAGLAVAAASTARLPWPRLAIWWPLGLLVGWTAIATLASPTRWVSFVGHYARYDGFLGVAAGAATVMVLVGFTWRAPDRLAAVAAAMVVGGLLDLGYVTLQELGLDWVTWYNEARVPIERPYGLLGNSNFTGAHLAIVVPFVLVLHHRIQHRAAPWVAGAICGWLTLGIWWTATRGGLLALVGGVAVAGTLAPALVPRVVRWGAIALTLVAVGLLAQASTTAVSGQVQADRPQVLQSGSLADRQEIWSAAVRMVGDHPLVGVGPDGLGRAFPTYRVPSRLEVTPFNADEAHDILLDRAATSGLPAVASYLWLLGVVGLAAWRRRRSLPTQHQVLLAAFGGGLAAYLLQGLVSIDVVPLALAGWVCIGALAVLADPGAVAARADAPAPEPRTVPLAIVAGCWVLAALLATLAVRPLVADVRYQDGVAAAAEGRPGAEAAAAFDAAISWNPHEPRYRARSAEQLAAIATREAGDPALQARLLQEALVGYQRALDLSPGDATIERNRARVLVVLADVAGQPQATRLDEAAAIYRDLVRRIPLDTDIRTSYGLVLELRGTATDDAAAARARDEAVRQFEAVLRRRPGTTAALAGLARIAEAEGRHADALRAARELVARLPGDPDAAKLLAQIEAQSGGGN